MAKDLTRKDEPSSWMVVFITHNLQEAHITAGRLEYEGIPVFVYQQAGAGALGIHIGNLGEIRILVNPSDYERALDILEPETLDELADNVDRIIYEEEEDDDEWDID